MMVVPFRLKTPVHLTIMQILSAAIDVSDVAVAARAPKDNMPVPCHALRVVVFGQKCRKRETWKATLYNMRYGGWWWGERI